VTNRTLRNTLHVSAWQNYSASAVLSAASSTDALHEVEVVNSSTELGVFVDSVLNS
jgi:hypothetical protein